MREKEPGLFYSSTFMANRRSIHMSVQHFSPSGNPPEAFQALAMSFFILKEVASSLLGNSQLLACSIKVTEATEGALGPFSMGLIKNSLALLKVASDED